MARADRRALAALTWSVPLWLALAAGGAASGLRFREASEAWGLRFRHHHGGTGELFVPETVSGGVLVLDYDGDGDQDVFFVDGGPTPGYTGEPPRSRLFRNEGGGRFLDATERSGIAVAEYGMGGAAGDVDGDGDLDIYVTAVGRDQLFRNRGDGSFEDATAAAGLGDPAWGASAAFADADGDGDLDLYVANYLDFRWDRNPVCSERGVRSYCHPDEFAGAPDRFYRNRGDGTFVDATREAGFGGEPGKGMGVLWSDLDGDGDQDLYVANDMTPNFLFHNLGSGRFEEIGLVAGVALGPTGQPEAGMGVDAVDVDGDGRHDIFVTNLDRQTNALYSNRGGLNFTEGRYASGVAAPSYLKVGFGAAFADFDQDGDPDLLVANGHIMHNIELLNPESAYRQANQALENIGGGVFRAAEGAGLDVVRASRGLALGDLDGDLDLDAVIVNSNEEGEVWENVTQPQGAALLVELAGGGANTAAIGAALELTAGGRTQVREARTASSYLSQNGLALHFGVGAAARVERLQARWPGGRRQSLVGLAPGRRLRLVEP